MKKTRIVKLAAIVLVVCLTVTALAGCGLSFNAKGYVKGSLDALYLGTFDAEYLKITDSTEADMLKIYEEGLKYEADYFISYFNLASDFLTDAMYQEIIDLYKTIYSQAKYEVGEVSSTSDGFTVKVTIYPMDIIQRVYDEDQDEYMAKWNEGWQDGTYEAMTEEEFEQFWARSIIDLFSARVNNIGYLEPQTISVQIVPDVSSTSSEKIFVISDDDLQRIDELILKY